MKTRSHLLTVATVASLWLVLAESLWAFYDPTVQRWINRDPIQEKGGMNLFAVNANDTINKVDKTGQGVYIPQERLDAIASGDCNKDPQVDPWELQRRHFPDDIDPYGGAYRHCVAACITAKCLGLLGCILNRLWDILYENDSPDSQGDKQGERVGESLATTMRRTPCGDACLTSYPAYEGAR